MDLQIDYPGGDAEAFRPDIRTFQWSLISVNKFQRVIAGAAVLAAATLAHTGAHASDADGNFALRGYGSRDCATFLAEFPDVAHASNYGSWLMGYATAHNRLQSETFDVLPLPDGAVFLQAISAVCTDQTTLTVEEAAKQVILAIAPLHQRGSTSIITIERDGSTLLIRQGALQALQSRLAERKLYSGPADGQWGEAIEAAIVEFQLREKITVTGLPDLATLFRAIVF